LLVALASSCSFCGQELACSAWLLSLAAPSFLLTEAGRSFRIRGAVFFSHLKQSGQESWEGRSLPMPHERLICKQHSEQPKAEAQHLPPRPCIFHYHGQSQ
jgi:hypothetical protein